MAKNKLKTHKGTKKVLNVRQSGSIKIGHPGTRHNTGKKNAASNRVGRTASSLSNSDYKRIKELI
jgi:ribosomal protein L35